MVDCEYVALPHYGLAEADIVYDLMNSLENERITRFMFLLVTVLKQNANIAKLVSQVVVIVMNYILSKLFVFKKQD